MATMIAKAYTIPTIARIRATCIGTQYVIETSDYLDIVTVNDKGQIDCTCHQVNCSHIKVVERRRACDRERDNLRNLHNALFNL